MKDVSQWCLLAALAGLVCLGNATSAVAQDNDRVAPGDRLNRLEQRLNNLAERQEQFMHKVGAMLQNQAPQPPPGPAAMRPAPMGQPWGPGPGQPPGPRTMRPGPASMGPQAPLALHAIHKIGGLVKLVVLVWLIANILLTVWIYSDIRKRGDGPGILIALALFAGIPAALIYALVRIGDKKS
jgi:hypothetical protein